MGHGDLSPASLLEAPSGLLVFTDLQHTGPAWQVLQDITHGLQLVQALELATLLISLRGLNRLEVLEAEEVLPTYFTRPMHLPPPFDLRCYPPAPSSTGG